MCMHLISILVDNISILRQFKILGNNSLRCDKIKVAP